MKIGNDYPIKFKNNHLRAFRVHQEKIWHLTNFFAKNFHINISSPCFLPPYV
jgi:hypothetical protein